MFLVVYGYDNNNIHKYWSKLLSLIYHDVVTILEIATIMLQVKIWLEIVHESCAKAMLKIQNLLI